MSEEMDLPSCPLCGRKLWMKEFDRHSQYAGRCDCGFHGPIKPSKLEAIAACNRRATTPLKPMDREAWEGEVRNLAALYVHDFNSYLQERVVFIDKILALQSQLTKALAEVESLKNRRDEDDYTITLNCNGKSLRAIIGKPFLDCACNPEKSADQYIKSAIGEFLEDIFRIKQINDENHQMKVALLHLADPGNMAARTLDAIEKARQPK